MHRPTVGLIAVVLLVMSAVLLIWAPGHDSPAGMASLRVAMVMAALWLALPQLLTLPRWLMLTILGTLAVVAWRPKALIIALPVLVLLVAMRPRTRRQ